MNQSISRRSLLALALAAAASYSHAEDFPNKPIRLLVGYGAGGMDVSARLLAQKLSVGLKQQVIVDNRPGASGMIAADYVSKQPADGYTILLAESGTLIAPLLQKQPVDPLKAFAPVSGAYIQPSMIVVNNDVKATNPQELIALLKANPGKYSFATSGIATPNALGFEMMKAQTKTFAVHVPYRGAAQILVALQGGEVPIGVMSAVSALPQVRAGRVRGVAMLSPDTLPGAESVPPLASVLPGFNVSARQFILAPLGTPAPIVERLGQAIRAVLNDPSMQKLSADQGNVPWPVDALQLGIEMKNESAHWAKVIKEQKITIE